MIMQLIDEFEYHLNALEEVIRHENLWPTGTPSKSQLSSTQPFAIDTLTFTEWLAYVFVPKCYQLIARGQLPTEMAVAPAAQMYIPNCPEPILTQLRALDVLTEGNK